MNENLTEIVCVIDRSGSMETTKADAIGGFNQFLSDQKDLEGEASLTLVLFDHEYQKVHDGQEINAVEPLTEATYVPRGTTALLDAVGRTIDDVGSRLALTPEEERPGQVIFVILTDGQENASEDYTYSSIKESIGLQRSEYNWEFIFLGANIDAPEVAASLNIRRGNSVTYASTSLGTSKALGQVNRAVSSYRKRGRVDASWKDDEEAAAKIKAAIDASSDGKQPES